MIEKPSEHGGRPNPYQPVPTVWMGIRNTMVFCATRGGKTAASAANASRPSRAADNVGPDQHHRDKYAGY